MKIAFMRRHPLATGLALTFALTPGVALMQSVAPAPAPAIGLLLPAVQGISRAAAPQSPVIVEAEGSFFVVAPPEEER